MVDDVLLNKVAIVERCIARVREVYAGQEESIATDPTRQDSIVLNLQRACEASIDLAMHMSRSRRLGLPQDAREAFSLLENAKLITVEVGERMRAMVGFRNVAVHQYQELSLPVLESIVQHHLDDFTDYTQQLIRAAEW